MDIRRTYVGITMVKIAQVHGIPIRSDLHLAPSRLSIRLLVFYYWIASAARGKLLAIIYQHLESQ